MSLRQFNPSGDWVMKTELDRFSALVGIDWADKKHDVCVQAVGSEQRQFSQVPHTVEAIDKWARAMQLAHGGPIAVAIELSKGPIVSALRKHDFFVIYPINPSTLAKYREAFKPSRAKDDPTDAEMALDLLLHHPDRFQPLSPQSVEMRTLSVLVEQTTSTDGRARPHHQSTATRVKAVLPAGSRMVRPYRYTAVLCVHPQMADC